VSTPRRFTVYGGDELEASLLRLTRSVADEVKRIVPPKDLVALVLLGGYGRGEGGVEAREGRERPHNNLDFLLLTAGTSRRRSHDLKQRIDDRLTPLAAAWEIGLDLGVLPAARLRRAPNLVMWYDLRHGHRTLAGDPDFVPSLRHLRVDRIPAEDVRNLLVNRGSLLLINDELAARGRLRAHRRTVVKHTVKAVLGYGDAYLFHRGLYHWSYREKQARFRSLEGVDAAFQSLYDLAMDFRFRPDYDRFLRCEETARWLSELRPRLEGIHLWTEARRLGWSSPAWSEYPLRFLRHRVFDLAHRPAALARRVGRASTQRLARAPRSELALDLASRAALSAADVRDRLALGFPAVAYVGKAHVLSTLAHHTLTTLDGEPTGTSHEELRRAYLRVWALHGDPNFGAVATRLGLDLREQEKAA
jgi:hypothetical protein